MSVKVKFKNKKGQEILNIDDLLSCRDKKGRSPKKFLFNYSIKNTDYEKSNTTLSSISEIAGYMIPGYLSRRKKKLLSQWERSNKFEPILVQKPLVSETHQFAAIIDCYGKLNGKLTLIEFISSDGIYEGMIIRIAALQALLEENGYELDGARILRFGWGYFGGFEEYPCNKEKLFFLVFLNFLKTKKLYKQIEKGELWVQNRN